MFQLVRCSLDGHAGAMEAEGVEDLLSLAGLLQELCTKTEPTGSLCGAEFVEISGKYADHDKSTPFLVMINKASFLIIIKKLFSDHDRNTCLILMRMISWFLAVLCVCCLNCTRTQIAGSSSERVFSHDQKTQDREPMWCGIRIN